MPTQTTTLAGGCFWCLEAVFDGVKGVISVESGFTGGHVDNPSYKEITKGTTGHAEVVQITFDPDIVTYRDLLNIFFTIHDPTTLNRQGADVGTQYRSAIFHHDDEQNGIAQEVMHEISEAGIWEAPIVTELNAYNSFYIAEDYHQDYYAKNPNQGYCQMVVAPKVLKFRKHFSALMK